MAEPTVDRRPRASRRTTRETSLPASLRARLTRTPPILLLGAAVLLVLMGQLVEDLLDSEPLQLLAPTTALRRWTLIVAALYMVVVSRSVDRYVVRSLAVLDAVIDVPADRFAELVARMRRATPLVEVGLLLASLAITVAIFGVLGVSLPIGDPVLPNTERYVPEGAAGVLVILGYALVGWGVLSLVYVTGRRARALGQLSGERLDVDVFDTSNLLPLGNIALATALAPAGIVVILVAGFGSPTGLISWTLLVLVTLASLVALLLPLRGIHRQMDAAKDAALARINGQLRSIFDEASGPKRPVAAEVALLNDRTSTLVNLRRTVGEMSTWPFRDTIAFGRAVLIAAAPLIYTIVSELIKVVLIDPIGTS